MHRKIMKVLNDPAIEFATIFSKDPWYGLNCGDKIVINLLQTLVPTIDHECLHDIYPDFSERKIMTLEEAVFQEQSYRQKIAVFNRFMDRVRK